MRDELKKAVIAAFAVPLALLCGEVRANETSTEVAAGGLSFAANPSIKIEQQGPQNHAPTREQIAERFAGAYGEKPWA